MSFTPDGQIHYYAKAGVEDLTSDDYLASYFPYNDRCVSFNNFFFNVANFDNGRSWSTSWIIDDPKVFVIPPRGQTVANLYRNRAKKTTSRNQTAQRSRSSNSSNSSQARKPRPTTSQRSQQKF